MKNLELIKKYQKEMVFLSHVGALLSLDQQVYMLKKSFESLSEQLALLSK